MFEKLPFKKKYLMIAASVFLLVVSYRFALLHTIESWQLNRQLHKQIDRQGIYNYSSGHLRKQVTDLNKITRLYQCDSSVYRSSLINTLSSLSERKNCKLLQLPEVDPLFQNLKFRIQKVEFEGDYFTILKTMDEIERIGGLGIVRSFAISGNANEIITKNQLLTLTVLIETTR